MEKYFEKYAAEFEATEVESPVSEKDFMRFYGRRTLRRRILIASSSVAAAAVVALALVFAFSGSRGFDRHDAVAVYIREYTESIRPIYKDMLIMEKESELCGTLNLSSVMKDMMESIPQLNREMKGVDEARRMEAMRNYCEAQSELISRIYGRCITSYEIDGAGDRNYL